MDQAARDARSDKNSWPDGKIRLAYPGVHTSRGVGKRDAVADFANPGSAAPQARRGSGMP